MPIKSLIFKELRSSAFVVSCGAIVFALWWLWMTESLPTLSGYSYYSGECILAKTDDATWYALLTGAFGIWLGMSMARRDSRGKLWQFSLFRPISRRTYFVTKLIVGALLSAIVPLVPLIAYFIWLRQPGVLLGPFDWSFVIPTGEIWIWSPVMFLAAFLAGLRDARWWWSRCWPIASVVGACFFVWFLPIAQGETYDVPLFVIGGVWCLFVFSLASSILSVAQEQDFS